MKRSKPQSRDRRKRILANRQRRIRYRLRERFWPDQPEPAFTARNIRYELSERIRGLDCGGLGVLHLLARRTGLIDAIDRRLCLLKFHVPYHESDHVLNMAYNIATGGICLEHLELRRNDEVYLDALGAPRIPDPTTAGDFCRRFEPHHVQTLMDVINEVRLDVWRQQDAAFFAEAIVDVDGHVAETTGECKEGMGLAYNGLWGYQALVVSLHNTGEPLYLVNRPGNRPSHEGAHSYLDRTIGLCRRAGFRRLLFRGDTDFSQTRHLDGWDKEGVRFIFGMDARSNLVSLAQDLPESAWTPLPRKPRYDVQAPPRTRPENVKERIVVEKAYENLRLVEEAVAAFEYRPTLCERTYRVVVVRKNLSVERGEQVLFDDVRYFFYLTNDWNRSLADLVELAHGRCQQENLIEQLKNGVHALRMPTGDLVSNWAYMVIASLAWTLKAWFALLLPAQGRWAEKYRREKSTILRMEFRTFLHAFVRVPCQIVRTSRRLLFRLLAWDPWQPVLLRAADAFRQPLRC